HIGAEFGEAKPQRDFTLERTAPAAILARGVAGLPVRPFARSLAGHDQRELRAVGLRPPQETQQRAVRLHQRHAVQVDAGVDGVVAAGDALLYPPAERSE